MANVSIKTKILLRNDTSANWETNSGFVLQQGEIGIENFSDGTNKIKIGDGSTTWASLPYFYAGAEVGYLLNDHIYTSSTYLQEIPGKTGRLYIDLNSNSLYYYDGTHFVSTIPAATNAIAGKMKLYGDVGQNTDGTITQKGISDALGTKVGASYDAQNEQLIFS